VAALSEEFGLTPKQSRTVQAYAVRNGLERVQEVADIVRSKPRENLGQSFMAGIRDGWKKPQSTVEKRATRKESAEPREWKRALHELYPNTGLGLYEVWANVPASLQQEVREHLAAAPRGT
jgi:hypothetical protein